MFHKEKLGVRKAFVMVFEMRCGTKGPSASQMARRTGVGRTTAWLFMHKVRTAMASSVDHPVEGRVAVDESVFGGRGVSEAGAQPGQPQEGGGRHYGGRWQDRGQEGVLQIHGGPLRCIAPGHLQGPHIGQGQGDHGQVDRPSATQGHLPDKAGQEWHRERPLPDEHHRPSGQGLAQERLLMDGQGTH